MTPTSVETSEQIEVAASLWAVKERPLSAQDEALLQAWLDGDDRRRGALLRAQATWASLSRAKALGPLSKWQASSPSLLSASRRKLLIAVGGSAAAAAAGLVGLSVVNSDETATQTGEIRRLPMSDGSIAAINTQSRLKIDMSATQRKIDLVSGEVWFKVAKNKARPFVVTAGLAKVQAVGTAFSVRRRAEGAEVLVTEGTVKAWVDGEDQPAVWLNAGERTIIGPKTPVAVVHAPDAIDNALAWREGQIALTGQSLFEAAQEYNRYNRVKIVIEDEGLGRERLLGRFSTDDPEGFSSAVSHAFGAEVTRTDNAIYIGAKKNNRLHTEPRTSDII